MTYRFFALSLLLSFGINITYAQKLISPFEDGIFAGKVMKVTQVDLLEKKKAERTALDSMLKSVTVYDTAGTLLTAFTFMPYSQDSSHTLYLRNKQTYSPVTDNAGLVKSVTVNSPHKSGVINYDRDGRVSDFYSYEPNGGLTAITYYKYDKNNNKKEMLYCNSAKNVTLDRKLKYNNKGNLIETDDYHGMELTQKTFYTYQAFDQAGNWLKRTAITHFENGTPDTKRITERQISYY